MSWTSYYGCSDWQSAKVTTMSNGQRLCDYCKKNDSKSSFFVKYDNGNCQTPKYQIIVQLKQQSQGNNAAGQSGMKKCSLFFVTIIYYVS